MTRSEMEAIEVQILFHKNTLLIENECLNEFTVEDLQYRENGWDRVHKDELVK